MKKNLYSQKLTLLLSIIIFSISSCTQDFEEVAVKTEVIQSTGTGINQKMYEEALKGGLEKAGITTNSVSSKGAFTDPLSKRVLVNGSIVGYGVSGYQQSYVSAAGNLMTPVAELFKKFEYTVSFSNGVLTATRNPEFT